MSYSSYYNTVQNSIVQRYLAMGSDEAARHAPIIRNLLTEELLKSELAPYLPVGLLISKGEVINGNESSGDCDLIVFRKPAIYQYGSVAIVPYENVRAIIDVEIHGERVLKALMRDTRDMSTRIRRKLKSLEKLKRFAKKVLCVGLHGHARSKVFKWWLTGKDEYKGPTPVFIFYTKHNKEIIIGEFERLVKVIRSLGSTE